LAEPQPGVYLLPSDLADEAWLTRCCTGLSLGKRRTWSYSQLETPIPELLASSTTEAKLEFSDLGVPVVVLAFLPKQLVHAFIRSVRENGPWPIVAVVTPGMMKMTLQELLTHLCDDRRKEDTLRKQNSRS